MLILSPNVWPQPATPYESEALDFCKAWQSGQTEFVLHTSGSTGTPKPIRLTRAQMQASAHLTGQTLGLQAGDPALVCLNIRYVAGIMMLVRGMELGLPMTILEPSSNPLEHLDLATSHFAFTALVPLQLQTILEKSPDKLPILNGMKAILVGGAATSPALEKALQVISAPIFATYGMTETVSHIALRRLNGPSASDVFTALKSVTLGTDERGCLHITSAATNFVRVQTNDVVELLDNLHFRLLGRADTIINSGGVKLQPELIEQRINQVLTDYGLSYRVFVAGLPDDQLGKRVVAFVEQAHSTPPELFWRAWETAQADIRQQIGKYAVPKDVIIVPNFAETPTGKLDRRATVATYLDQSPS
ncbi:MULTISPECIES: AMP-binding protein [unclassified Spirosoma]|uniref:AMP-binding protein n=1 Tax=unclassified Spirosoma TaxID=2621999 RepID=UPI00095E4099|nr:MULTISPECIES: AMP-binding protein [unclassified Spirosoma]MBN8821554.1 AMP-binding protein [Spirosoma sp.]OJW78331.1 MAG: O-succinylbenzoic acid--CoA ligase [Spirosoma sp. 48-14]